MNSKDSLKKYLLHALAFVLPAIILIAVLKTLSFYPFGDKTLLIMDMRDQYVHFFSSLKDLVLGDSSLFFSWSKSMGQNYIGLFAYYLASPLSFITLFFSREMLPLGIVVLTVIKISLCGLTFSVYLDKVFGENRVCKLYFTICYALMSYNLVYSMSLMWLDAVILLPIILLGIENIIKGKKATVFVISIGIMFISNYYIAYAVSIFCVIYYFFRWFSLNKVSEIKLLGKNILKITLSALAGMGLSAWLVVPTIIDLSMRGTGWKNTNTFNFPFWEIFKKFTPNYYDSITNSGLPAIYCGLGITLLAVAFFFNRKILLKIKLMSAGIVGVFLLSFWIVKLDEFWNAMQTPNWFPYRYVFLFSFFMILTAYTQFANMEIKLEGYVKKAACIFFIVLISTNMYLNSVAMINGLNNQFGYQSMNTYKEFCNNINTVLNDIHKDDSSMFRVEKDYEYSKNDAMLFGFNGITHYSSTYNKNINSFNYHLGMAQNHFWNSYFGSTPVTDSIFSVKYIIAKKPMSEIHSIVREYDGITLYKNDNYLPIGFAILGEDAEEYVATSNPFINQNKLLNGFTGLNGEVFRPIEYNQSFSSNKISATYNFTAVNNEPVYLYTRGGWKYADVYVNGNYISEYFSGETKVNLYIGTFTTGEQVEIKLESKRSEALEVYSVYISYIDREYYKNSIKKLREESFYDIKQTANGLNAKLITNAGRVCFTSIPYAKGFTVKINGEKVNNFSYADTYMAFNVPKGEFDVEIRFVSPGFYLGLAISVSTLAILILLLIKSRYRNNRETD